MEMDSVINCLPRSGDKTPMPKCHHPKPLQQTRPQPSKPKYKSQWYFSYWCFVYGIHTEYLFSQASIKPWSLSIWKFGYLEQLVKTLEKLIRLTCIFPIPTLV